MEIHEYSDEQLKDEIETFKDRIETMFDYISDTEDSYTRSNMQTQLQRYKMSLKYLEDEKLLRASSNYNRKESIESNKNFEIVKKEILDKLDVRVFNQKYLYIDINRASNFNQFANIIKLKSRTINSIGFINEQFLNQIPENILLERKIYINKQDILEENEISIFINSKSKHKNKSESYHYGNCISEHYDNSESYHHNNSKSEHWDKSQSVHFDKSSSIHHNKTHSQHYNNSKYSHSDDCTFSIDKD